ncbi:MAG: hypothetical protein AAF740_13695, partial [Bacteroidota bacterium]
VLGVFSVIGKSESANITEMFASDSLIGKMLFKSISGYLIAFGVAVVVYAITSRLFEEKFIQKEATIQEERVWAVLQWASTGFLWTQWLAQDLVNIYVYLPRGLNTIEFVGSTALIMGLLAYIMYQKGGAVQKVVKTKTNTTDIRSATIVDFIYGIILLVLKGDALADFGISGNLPMSTTWVFIGLLAGREFMISAVLKSRKLNNVTRVIAVDFGKVMIGLVVSVILIIIIALAEGATA